jgi:ABC-2 type transport system permease protein
MSLPRLIGAFLRRDAAIARSYRFAFFFELSAAATISLMFFFVSHLISPTALVTHGVADGKYFPFVLVGIVSLGLFDASLLGPSSILRSDQVNGTLEPLLATPTPAWAIVAIGPAFQIVRAVVLAAVTIAFGAVALGLDIRGGLGGVLVALAILVPTLVMSVGAGLLLAAVTVLVRRAERATHFVSAAIALGCGVYYPVSVLPSPFHQIAGYLPPAWFLSLERAALYGDRIVLWKVAGLVVGAIVFSALGALGLNAALNRARRRGALTHY